MGVFKLCGMTLKSLFKKAPTRKYPYEIREPFERTRGRIRMADIKSCILCGLCARKCPAYAIEVDKEQQTWTYYPHKCIYCDSCVRSCPKSCLTMEHKYASVVTKLEPEVYKKPPLTPEEQAEKERKDAEKKAKREAALKAKAQRDAANGDKNSE